MSHSRPHRPPLPRPVIVPSAAALLVTGLLGAQGPLGAQSAQTPSCTAEEHGHFDFWVGEWEVFRPDGTLAGTNTIRKVLGGCALHESYTTPSGYRGESFNIWDGGREVWHQTWVDSGGLLLTIEGGIRDGAMVLEGTTVGGDGSETLNRITWSVVDGDPDRVRQLWQTSTDGGSTWSVAFDGEYRRRDPGGR